MDHSAIAYGVKICYSCYSYRTIRGAQADAAAHLEKEMSEERKARLRQLMEEIYNEGNLAAMDDLYAPDIVRHASAPLPDLAGIDAYKAYLAPSEYVYSDLQLAVDDIICEGDTCAMRYTLQMTHTGYNPVFDLQATGKRAAVTASVTSRWVDGKIAEEWIVADLLGFLQQLGAMPTPGQS
jgi:predicted ester cyclase